MLYAIANPLEDPTTKWLLIGFAVLTVAYSVFRPMLKRKDPLEKPAKPSQPGQSLAQQRAVEREMSRLLVELSEMTRQISAQLDTRAAKLELLIKEADEKLAALRGVPAAGNPLLTADGPSAPSDNRHAEVYALADKGHSIVQIAQQLERPSGEVELILALRPKS